MHFFVIFYIFIYKECDYMCKTCYSSATDCMECSDINRVMDTCNCA